MIGISVIPKGVMAMPVYWYSTPAQVKGVIDSMFSFVIGSKDVTGKK